MSRIAVVGHRQTATSTTRLLSPFRYPGGKSWLVPIVVNWIGSKNAKPAEFFEPFGGGCIVGLNIAYRWLADSVTLVELDEDVAAVWHTIISGNARQFADRIAAFELTPRSLQDELAKRPGSLEDKAFQTIIRNRVNRGGVLAPGAGMLKHGENGKGITSRWYPATLRKRILEIAGIRERITFIEGDGVQIISKNAKRNDVCYFIDPPYTAGGKHAGRRLYSHFEVDHEALFRVAATLVGDFLMTYSDNREVRRLARQYDFETRKVTMRSSHHRRLTELLIGRDLGWTGG